MSTTAVLLPEQGQMVKVRSRKWIVTDVAASTLPVARLHSGLEAPQHLLTLSSVEDDALGEELNVIWEIEPGTHILNNVDLPAPTGFDPPDQLDAVLDAVRWGASSSADVRSIQAPFRSGIDIEDYQLDPIVRAIQMPRANLLIADDVGLGKTIEAGMVALELIIRHRARKILVVCPASLQVQWQEQMRDKFGLDFRIVDSNLMKDLRRSRGIHVNPWNHFPRLITSIDFLKRERPLRMFRELLPGQGEPAFPRKFDLLIVDEAHNCAPSGRGKYATDSLRTEALRLLAPHFEHKLFLTATPHNGYPESFSALLELLDNQRFARATTPDRKQLAAVMVRRMKSELPPKWDGSLRFPQRIIEPIEVPYTDEEREIHAALEEYSGLRAKRAQDNAESMATEFVLKTLKKRLFSSPAAFLTTLEQHRKSLQETRRGRAARRPTIGILRQELDRMNEEYADDTQYDDATADALDSATLLFSEPSERELALLNQMQQWAEKASRALDSKVNGLIDWLNTHIRPGKKWGTERVILFTEYRATQKWLKEILAQQGFTGGDRLMTMHGGMDLEEREQVKAAFQAGGDETPVRILLATDAAAEGLNLQNHCHRLIHYEIPWNPNRLEQRNGRIDRHGQKGFLSPSGERQVFIYHFVGKGYKVQQQSTQIGLILEDVAPYNAGKSPSKLDADLEFLMRVAQKVETIRADLGSYGTVLADDVEHAMLGGGYSMRGMKVAEARAEPARKQLKFERDLTKQIGELLQQYQETQRELHLSPENIQKVVEVGLNLAEQPALIPNPLFPGQAVFTLPALKHSWAACAEGLEHPFSRQIRPITFDHAIAAGRDDIVLIHLNHRLVQMCLRLLRAEAWSEESRKQLHRITARLVPNHMLSTPAVIAHARLVVVGGDSHRLHEEIITAGGIIKEGRFSRMNIGELEKLTAIETTGSPHETMKKQLLDLWDRIEPGLKTSLDVRMKQLMTGLEKKLTERAEKEANDIRMILLELKKAIDTELAEPDSEQLLLFDTPEKEQFERNRDFLRARSLAIPEEIERETAAVAARFADPQPRIFPVAVTFLVPERMAKG
ncbi:MAG: DISARM system SNF2-like helicase DrmD [Bacteroidota bacterium]